MSYLSTVNRVLRRLREDSVTTTDESTYSQLISDFVRDSYSELADEHIWEALYHRVHVDVSASSTVKFDLTRNVTAGGAIRDADARACKTDSELSFINEGAVPEIYVYDSDSDEQPDFVRFLTPEDFRYRKALDRVESTDTAAFVTVYPELDSTVNRLYMEIWPTPSAAKVYELVFWTKPDELAEDSTDDALEFLVPEFVVFQLALMYALNERGEEIGEPGNLAEARYLTALADARDKDISSYKRADRYDWSRD